MIIFFFFFFFFFFLFPDDKLNSSNAFIISFMVNNHKNPKDNEMAEAWEAEYIKFLKNYSSPNMTISFSAEVSKLNHLTRATISPMGRKLDVVLYIYISEYKEYFSCNLFIHHLLCI